MRFVAKWSLLLLLIMGPSSQQVAATTCEEAEQTLLNNNPTLQAAEGDFSTELGAAAFANCDKNDEAQTLECATDASTLPSYQAFVNACQATSGAELVIQSYAIRCDSTVDPAATGFFVLTFANYPFCVASTTCANQIMSDLQGTEFSLFGTGCTFITPGGIDVDPGTTTLPCGTRIASLYSDNPALFEATESLGGDIDVDFCSTDTTTATIRCLFNPTTVLTSGPLTAQVEAFQQACSDAGGDEATQAFNITCENFDDISLDLAARFFIMPACSFKGCADQTPLVSYAVSYERSAEAMFGIDCVTSAAITNIKNDIIAGPPDGTSGAMVGWTTVAAMFIMGWTMAL
jgi:hypothetical protein